MVAYDDDDLADYDDDYAADEVFAVFGSKVSEDEVYDALEEVDYDVDLAVAKLKQVVAAREKPKELPKPKPADPEPPKGKLTKLQMLSRERELRAASDNASKPSSALDRLRKAGAASPGGLSRLQSSSRASSPRAESPGLSSAPQRLQSPPVSADPNSRPASPSRQRALANEAPQISYDVPSAHLAAPSPFAAVLASKSVPPAVSVSNSVSTVPKASQAFAEPSPDQKVIAAQKNAFEKSAKSSTASPPPQPAPTKPKDELLASLRAMQLKPHISFVVIGHVDSGKSTLMGRMLLDMGVVSKKTVQKFEHESANAGKSSFALAWVMDATKEERDRGVTVDIAEESFESSTARFTIVDAPGHRDYVPNMIAGVSQADVAVLVVDSDTNAFESGFSLSGQTREHAILARSLGIDTLIVAVNKFDLQDWNMSRFEEISVQLTEFLSRYVGYSSDNLVFVPTSGKSGENVVHAKQIQGYKGPSLLQALENVEARSYDPAAPFRFVVSNVFTEKFQSAITVAGRVASGAVEKGDHLVNCSRPGDAAIIKNAHMAVAGEIVDINIDASLEFCRPGDVLAVPESRTHSVTSFKAKVVFFDLKKPVLTGTKLSFYMGRVNQTVKLANIETVFTKQGEKRARHILKRQSALVTLELSEPAVVLPFTEAKSLGRFVLRLAGETVGGGIVQST